MTDGLQLRAYAFDVIFNFHVPFKSGRTDFAFRTNSQGKLCMNLVTLYVLGLKYIDPLAACFDS